MTDFSKDIAKVLLDVKAVFLRPSEPFTWASGIKSPIYCDNRLILGNVKERVYVETALSKMIQENYPDVEVIMGTSTAGIPHAAYVSDLLDLPMGYVRTSAKDHGRQNQIEGANPKGKKVVVIEDLISTAGSVLEVCNVLKEHGAEVLGIASIFTYNLAKGKTRLAEANVINNSLSNFEALAEVALLNNYISKEEYQKVLKFRENPDDASWME